ncbi:UDP-N-acetylmuramoyl-tripeptide--D-alanyl-D-alanine ligase [Coralloluteibacterium stylophorae]|uniref:UDP-N-acetylmuramoyl-tripeptide--D-alanyl-D-alanine ligase n=1 Tax=Coralloluteibacterium stylophorae TaxID=1776034 RepID=A0A8J7VW94_9GAMM|nr:UDP-N-acetylmuramoyl-tripeptide--D-alanyl-D-alanine ligase [Coralloluteibacterium stylophorae]MBS7457745.1 UDP-N-acetylmuramoyl-tripeptide--D-alanyl-D-alanine ligase [Coralloluteibacterium stylophorae]
MRRVQLAQLAAWCDGRIVGADVAIDAVAIDSRAVASGALFVALRGERVDGHDFVPAAADAGAAAALVEREVDAALPQLLVADAERALAGIAAGIQAARTTRVAAITGSNGKTTVKTMLGAILARAGRAYANPGNRNNEIGLPLAVLDAPEDADFAVYEMGAGKPGDIAYLTAVARPHVALVNNVAPAHLERMGSLLGVAETKGAIYRALPEDGVAVINADDAFAPYFRELAGDRRVLDVGLEASAAVTASDIVADAAGSRFRLHAPEGAIDVALPFAGRHNVRNALAAAACALGLGAGLDAVRDGLAAAPAVAGRQVAHALAGGVVLIDDSYNANPGSVAAAIDTLAAAGGEAWLVLGEMKELGADEARLHADVGTRARERGIARLFALGPLNRNTVAAFGAGARQFDTHAALIEALRAELDGAAAGTRVLVKGSRSAAMDRVVAALLPAATKEDSAHAA